MERETGIEPATNSLEGCDSTTELLPLMKTSGPRARPSAFPVFTEPRGLNPEPFQLVGRGGFEPP